MREQHQYECKVLKHPPTTHRGLQAQQRKVMHNTAVVHADGV
jgi:hypothetical protein